MKQYKTRKKHPRRPDQRDYPFYPNQFLRILMAVMGTVALVAALSALFPLALDQIADPLGHSDPEDKVLWILKPAILLGDLVLLPGVTVVLIAFLAVLFVLLPVLDRSGQRSLRRRILVAVPFLLWMLFLAFSLLLSTGAGL